MFASLMATTLLAGGAIAWTVHKVRQRDRKWVEAVERPRVKARHRPLRPKRKTKR